VSECCGSRIYVLMEGNAILRREIYQAQKDRDNATAKLAAADAEVSVMAVTMSQTNLAMIDLQRQLAAAEATNINNVANWQLRCEELQAKLTQTEALWAAAIEAEGTDWADDIVRSATEALHD
jgi:hypothetical protein